MKVFFKRIVFYCLFELIMIQGNMPIEMDRSYTIGNHGNWHLRFNKFSPNEQVPKFNSEVQQRMKDRKHVFKISSAKYIPEMDSENIHSKTQYEKEKAVPYVENSAIKSRNKSTNFLTDLLQSITKDKGLNRNIVTIKDFDSLKRILDDSRRLQVPVKYMYEVPMIEKQNEKVDNNTRSIHKNTQKSSNLSLDVTRNKSKSLRFETFDTDSDKVLTASVKSPDAKVTKGRFLSIFEVVNFNNVDCISSNGLRGICLHRLECADVSGVEMGSCADGFGICCLFQYSCGDQTSSNCSTFTNPGFPKPSTERISCTLTINKANPSINQLKLDFVQMELQPPTNGSCVDDQFIITGQNVNNIVPVLCGINNGQHMFIDVGDSPGPFYMSVLTASAERRLFQVGVCQTTSEASPGCLQKFIEPVGSIESFNYQIQGALQANAAPGYFNNLNYAICIERASQTCSITYSNSDDAGEYEYQILNYDSDGVPIIPPEQAGAEIFNCPDDFIVINGIRLCGERLNDASVNEDFTSNAPVTELSAGPIVFIFRTNGNVTGRGFKLFYKQNPCVSPRN